MTAFFLPFHNLIQNKGQYCPSVFSSITWLCVAMWCGKEPHAGSHVPVHVLLFGMERG